jgi:hypothetical protein
MNYHTMCIYYTDTPGLHFKSQEHVIPAAIGGRKKLPVGYVSDEFNNDISKLEREFIQKSVVSMAREIEGPGKRGKLAEKYATKSRVFVISSSDKPGTLALGYLVKGKGIEIPQIVFDTATGHGNLRLSSPLEINSLKQRLSGAVDTDIRVIIDDRIPEHTILLGAENSVEEHFTIFVAKNTANSFQIDGSRVVQLAKGIAVDLQETQERYKPIFTRQIEFKTDYLRIYGKMAFNLLASKMGKEFVLSERFNPVRYWIARGEENHFAKLADTLQGDIFRAGGVVLPDSCHLVFISKVDDILVAKVMLYGALSVDIILSDGFPEEFEPCMLICDWRTQQEYNLIEYVAFWLSNKK